jgi:hypothetical protein
MNGLYNTSNVDIGITDQSGMKVLFNCKKGATAKRHVAGALMLTVENKDLKCRILPYCPSCGDKPPESFLEELRSKGEKSNETK